MEFILIVLGAGVAVYLVSLLIKHQRRWEAQIDACWRRVAGRLDGTFHKAVTHWLRGKPRRLVAHVGGLELTADHYTVRSNKSSQTYTRVVGPARAPHAFELKVYASHLLSGLARAIGFQDVAVGDTTFDENFTVKSNDPEAAELWLNATVRKAIWEVPDVTLEIARGKITATVRGLIAEPERLTALIHATAAVADGRQRVMKAWKKLAKRHRGKVRRVSDRWAQLDVELDGVPVTVDTKKIGGHHYTFARARVLGERLEPFVLACDPDVATSRLPRVEDDGVPEPYALWCAQPQLALGYLHGSTGALLERLEPAAVACHDDHVQVTWDGVSVAPAEIERGMELAVALASKPRSGPYR